MVGMTMMMIMMLDNARCEDKSIIHIENEEGKQMKSEGQKKCLDPSTRAPLNMSSFI